MKCQLCGREIKTTKHHLYPKMVKTRNKYKEIKGKNETVELCQPCHGKIHSVYTEKELFENYNTIEKLLQSDEIEKFVKWIKNKNIEYISSKEKK